MSKINKGNWKLRKVYLEYRRDVDQLCPGSYRKEETYTQYLLTWAGLTPFIKTPGIRPTLPEYLKTNRLDGESKPLSPGYINKILATARRFFLWLEDNQSGYKGIKRSWINTIKIKRQSNPPRVTDAVTFPEIIRIAKTPVKNLVEERIRAAAIFLYLSGMRIGAFVSLPLKAVNLATLTITQYPSLGVRTKNGKYAITYLFNIPELLEVVLAWDKKVRAILPEDGYWFAPISPETCEIDLYCRKIGEHRETIARKNLYAWLNRIGLKYHSPHKFRHGHIQYGQAFANSQADLKTLSDNVMHANTLITDQVYSNIPDSERQRRMQSFTNEPNLNKQIDDFKLFQEFMEFRQRFRR
jgi:integrase/recombinase XerD